MSNMGYIVEEIEWEGREDVSIHVEEKVKKELSFGGGSIISLNTAFADDMYSPKQLVKLGQWLVEQGTRIGKEYTKSGHKIRE